MEPISTAIIAAIAAGAASGTGDIARKSIVDAYQAIKKMIQSKFGKENMVSQAITEMENDPESKGRQILLTEQIVKAKADQDDDIVKAAENLMEEIKQIPGGNQHIMNAWGEYIAQADRGGSATININKG